MLAMRLSHCEEAEVNRRNLFKMLGGAGAAVVVAKVGAPENQGDPAPKWVLEPLPKSNVLSGTTTMGASTQPWKVRLTENEYVPEGAIFSRDAILLVRVQGKNVPL